MPRCEHPAQLRGHCIRCPLQCYHLWVGPEGPAQETEVRMIIEGLIQFEGPPCGHPLQFLGSCGRCRRQLIRVWADRGLEEVRRAFDGRTAVVPQADMMEALRPSIFKKGPALQAQLVDHKDSVPCRRNQTNLEELGRNRANLEEICRNRTKSDAIGRNRTKSDIFGLSNF